MIWEYLILEFSNYDSYRLVEQELDEQGSEGWELVTVVPGPTHTKMYLKRPETV